MEKFPLHAHQQALIDEFVKQPTRELSISPAFHLDFAIVESDFMRSLGLVSIPNPIVYQNAQPRLLSDKWAGSNGTTTGRSLSSSGLCANVSAIPRSGLFLRPVLTVLSKIMGQIYPTTEPIPSGTFHKCLM